MKKGTKLIGRKPKKFGMSRCITNENKSDIIDLEPEFKQQIKELENRGWYVFPDSYVKDHTFEIISNTHIYYIYCRVIFLGKNKCKGCTLKLKDRNKLMVKKGVS